MEQGNQNDRLGNLPDSILISILDRLNVREAARTSVLSRRCPHLPAFLSQLRINVSDFLPGGAPTIQDVVRSNTAVVEATQSILGRRDSSRYTIQFLFMKFFLRDDDCISIGHAVGYAMATQKVEIAEFIVMKARDDDVVNSGRQFMLFFVACPGAFGGLTRLHLEKLILGTEFNFSNILSTCKRLKHLHLRNCNFGSYTKLQVEHSQLEGWIDFECPIKISFGYVPLLEAMSLTNCGLSCHKMVKLSKFLWDTSVRDLKLGFDCEKIWVQPEYPTKRLAYVFHQLSFVNLVEIPEGYDLTLTFFLLEAAPNLKELYMTVRDHLCKMERDAFVRRFLTYSKRKGVEWESSASDFQHQNLATLVMFGFQSEYSMLSYVRRVLKAAVKLQDAFLYIKLTCSKCYENPSKPFRFPFTAVQQSLVKKRITRGSTPLP